jgi:hypothetical protein
MQQTLGNQAVQQRASTCPAFPSACPTGGACHICPVRVQAKLAISQPGDQYEQEADRVAEAVMRMPGPQAPAGGADSGGVQPSTVPPIVHEVLRSPGQPLNSATCAFFEPRCGHDFSRLDVFSNTPAVEHRAYPFTTMIPRANLSIFRDDGALEEEPTNEAAGTESETPVQPTAETEEPAAREPKEGETVRLPDIEPQDVPAFTIAQADPVNPTLYYTPHVEQLTLSNACPIGKEGHAVFGVTNVLPPSIINVSVTPVLGWYYVDATLDQKITYQVCDGVGPQGQVDITSENDPKLTKENYWEVAQDLTPNSKGEPPRRLYYASDLTLRHERFHATEWAKVAQVCVPNVQKWLMGKIASSVFEIYFLLQELGNKFMTIVGEKFKPGAEDRAYGDGVSLYRARSKAIIAKGDAGGYPKWDWKKGLP